MKNEVELFLVSAFTPIGNTNQKPLDNFIEKLEICISRKHPNDILVIGCNTNASIGTSYKCSNYGSTRSIGPFSLTQRNKAGVRFNSCLEVNNLVAVTTYYKKNNYTTWTHPRSKLPHQIDHIITQKNDICRFVDAGATAPLIYSDHKAVICKLRISAHLKKRFAPRQKLAKQNHYYLNSQDAKTLFCQSILNELPINHETSYNYADLAHALEKAAHETLSKLNRQQPQGFKQNEVSLKSLIEKRNSALSLKILDQKDHRLKDYVKQEKN